LPVMPVMKKRQKKLRVAHMTPKVAAPSMRRDDSVERKATIQRLVEEEIKKNGYSRENDPFVRAVNNVITRYKNEL
jgi:hypothetical protein